jgi:prophage regulatory protein
MEEQKSVLSKKQVQAITGLSPYTIMNYVKAGLFPAPIQLGPRRIGWLNSEVNSRIAAWAAERPPAKAAEPPKPLGRSRLRPQPPHAVPSAPVQSVQRLAASQAKPPARRPRKPLQPPKADGPFAWTEKWMAHDGVIEPLVSTGDVAKWIGFSNSTVHKYAAQGILPAVGFPIGNTGRVQYYFRVAEIESTAVPQPVASGVRKPLEIVPAPEHQERASGQ